MIVYDYGVCAHKFTLFPSICVFFTDDSEELSNTVILEIMFAFFFITIAYVEGEDYE